MVTCVHVKFAEDRSVPRGSFVFSRKSAMLELLLRDVTGKLSRAIGGLCSVLERKMLFLVGITSMSCWMLLDGHASA